MVEVESDLTLISKIQGDNRDGDSLIMLMDRHLGYSIQWLTTTCLIQISPWIKTR